MHRYLLKSTFSGKNISQNLYFEQIRKNIKLFILFKKNVCIKSKFYHKN